jgi:hypothetical protein
MSAGLEPACGSVKAKQPTHSPAAIFGRYLRFCASLPSATMPVVLMPV